MVMPHEKLRTDEALARGALEAMVGAEHLDAVARVVARSVEFAASRSPYAWELTLTPSILRLNVGQDAVLSVSRRGLSMCVLGRLDVVVPAAIDRVRGGAYHDIGGRMELWTIPFASIAKIPAKAMTAHQRLIAKAGEAKARSPWKYAHSASVLPILSAAIGRKLAQPLYHKKSPASPNPAEASSDDESFEAPDPAIEKRAVARAIEFYRKKGWVVQSVERDRVGYDLHCTKATAQKHVEVKGLSGRASGFVMTGNEMTRLHEDPCFELFVLSGIAIKRELAEVFPRDTALNRFTCVPTEFRLTAR